MQVIRRPKFVDDLASSYAWIPSDNIAAAERLLSLTAVTVARLQRFPFIGVPREELGAGLRSIRISPFPHLLFYRVEGRVITLIRLLHGARDLPRTDIES
jgi:toxin ParE1/3/4